MKISIITVVRNNAATVRGCVESVLSQTYPVEYIVIDGCSADGTLDIIKKYGAKISKVVSEPDKGIYDAMNKGIKVVTGDIIGMLNSDDVYASDIVIERVADCFSKKKVDSCYGDLVYVNKNNSDKIIRYWKAGEYKEGLLKRGWMPPHPTFFAKKEIYDKYGYFNPAFKIAADYELMLRFLGRYKISTYYIPGVFIKMRVGGASNKSLMNLIIKTTEDYKAWKVNDLNGNWLAIFLKNISKIPQFFLRKK